MTRKGIVTNWPLDGSRHIVSPKNARVFKDALRNGARIWGRECRICGAILRGFWTRSEAIEEFRQHEQKEHAQPAVGEQP